MNGSDPVRVVRVSEELDSVAEHFDQAAALLAGLHTLGPADMRDPAATVVTTAAHTHATLALTAAIVAAPADRHGRPRWPWGRLLGAAGLGAGMGFVLAAYALLGGFVLGLWP